MANRQQGIVVLGSTGSIGTQTLDLVRQHPERFRVIALAAHQNHALMFQQCQEYLPQSVVMVDPIAAKSLEKQCQEAGLHIEILTGLSACSDVVAMSDVDSVMLAMVGSAGLMPALAAAKAGKTILLANKESLVMAGQLFMDTCHAHQATVIPVDSEHNAIYQCLPRPTTIGSCLREEVHSLVLTASGGPFRTRPLESFSTITPSEAVCHPNWSMGKKISIDSATMMNKALEVIEAHFLFGIPASQIDVIIHPESVIHGMVKYLDGSIIAGMAKPDMHVPIAHALGLGERMPSGVGFPDLTAYGQLTFEAPDDKRYPCLGLAYETIQSGQAAMITLNAANEVAVDGFLEGRISFEAIFRVINETVHAHQIQALHEPASLDDITSIDGLARHMAVQVLISIQG